MKKIFLLLLSTTIFLSCLKRTGDLEIRSTPPGIKIWLDGENTGYVTPHLFTKLYAGLHLVKLEDSYYYWEDTFTLPKNKRTTLDINFPELKWTYDLSGAYITGSPAIGLDGTIYIGSQYNLYAINPNGSLKWNFSGIGYDYGFSSPAIDNNGIVYVSSEYRLYAINPNGILKWTFPAPNYSSSPPAIGSDGTIYFANGNYLYAINPNTGDSIWRYTFSTSSSYVQPSAPAIASDGTIYLNIYGMLYAIKPNGTLKWQFNTNYYYYYYSSLAIGNDGTIYFSLTPYLYAINPNGTLKWKDSIGDYDYSLSSPSIGKEGTIYLACGNRIYAINPDKTIKWCYVDVNYYYGYSKGSPTIANDGTVYIYYDKLTAIGNDGKLKWKFGQYSSYSQTSPTITADSILYFTDYQRLYAVKISSTLANSSWPMFQHDAKHTGRIGGGK